MDRPSMRGHAHTQKCAGTKKRAQRRAEREEQRERERKKERKREKEKERERERKRKRKREREQREKGGGKRENLALDGQTNKGGVGIDVDERGVQELAREHVKDDALGVLFVHAEFKPAQKSPFPS